MDRRRHHEGEEARWVLGEVYAVVFATHPLRVVGRELHRVVKYAPGITRAITGLGSPAAVRKRARERFVPLLRRLGPVSSGAFPRGTAFGIETVVDWWLVGPAGVNGGP